jgi:hypothetical protein
MKFLLSLLFLSGIISCSKKGSSTDDKAAPVITITSPTNNQVFNAGATVNINGTMTDNSRISEVHIHVYDNGTGTLLMDMHANPGATSYSLNQSYTAQSGIQYKIQVSAKDNSGNEGIVSVTISTN